MGYDCQARTKDINTRQNKAMESSFIASERPPRAEAELERNEIVLPLSRIVNQLESATLEGQPATRFSKPPLSELHDGPKRGRMESPAERRRIRP